MTKIKGLKLLFCLLVMQSIPAHAVTEPAKVMQYSLRAVEEVAEAAMTLTDMIISIDMTVLQGLIGSIKPSMPELSVDMESFAPTLPTQAKSLLSSNSVVPNVRKYVEEELKSRSFNDPVADRDVLVKINELLNIKAKEAIALGKQTEAKLNKAVEENETLLSLAADSENQQKKQVQEAALGIDALANDALYYQLQARRVETLAQRIIADIHNSKIGKEIEEDNKDDEDDEEVDATSDEEGEEND